MFPLLMSAQLFFLASVFLVAGVALVARLRLPATPFAVVFIFASLGAFLAVTSVALVRTDGKTVFLPGLLPLMLVLWRLLEGRHHSKTHLPQGFLRALATHAVALAALSSLHFGLRADPTDALAMKIPFPDLSFYGRLADALLDTGEESRLGHHAGLAREFGGPIPYHYFEMWIAGTLSRLTGSTGTVALAVPTVALLDLLVLSGLWALMEAGGGLNPISQGVAFLALFLPPGIVFVRDSQSLFWEATHYSWLLSSLFTSTKVLQIVWIALAAALAVLKERRTLGGCILLLLVPISTVVAPAALVASMILIFASASRFGSRESRSEWLWLLGPVLVATATVVFFACLGNRLQVLPSGPLWADIGLRTRINIAGATLLRLPIVLPSCLVFSLVCWRSRGSTRRLMRSVAEVGLGLSLGGAVSLGLLTPVGGADVYQLSSLPISAAACLAVFATLATVLDVLGNRPLWRAVVVGLVALAGAGAVETAFMSEHDKTYVPYYRRYSGEYLRALTRLRLETPRGGFIVAPGDVGPWDLRKPLFSFNPPVYTVGGYVGIIPRLWTPIQLSVSSQVFSGDPLRVFSVFGAFSDELRRENPALSEGECQRRFVVLQDMSFLIVTASGVLPEELADLIDFVVTDKATGERFMVLRRGLTKSH